MNEHHQPFEEIKLINANGAEQWSARQLGKLLGYSEYRHFIPVLTRANRPHQCHPAPEPVLTPARLSVK